MKERRKKTLIHLLEYLHNPIFLLDAETDAFGEYAKRKQVYSLPATLLQILLGVKELVLEHESQFVASASLTEENVEEREETFL